MNKLKDVIYVATEGNTELKYLQDVVKTNPRIKLINLLKSSDPLLLCKKLIDKLNMKEFRYVERAWVVFDFDDRKDRVLSAFQLINEFNRDRKQKIEIAYMKPCFEVWCLIHFIQAKIPVTSKGVQIKLEEFMPSYNHNKSPYIDISKLTEDGYIKALKLSKKWESEYLDSGEYGNYFAGIYNLINQIK